jgi:putative effector of murein hydrolase LrgA (UPF0299 family)
MIDLSKPPNEKTMERIGETFNLRYRLSFFPYLFTILFLPLAVGIVLYNYKIHIFWIGISVVLIVTFWYYLVIDYFKEHKKR